MEVMEILTTGLFLRIHSKSDLKIEGDIAFFDDADSDNIPYRFTVAWDGKIELMTADANEGRLYIGDIAQFNCSLIIKSFKNASKKARLIRADS